VLFSDSNRTIAEQSSGYNFDVIANFPIKAYISNNLQLLNRQGCWGMHVHDDHMYHGAALIQIAEHEQFTAINALKIQGEVIPVAYRINDDIAVYLKYASKPSANKFKEYPFTFKEDQLEELESIFEANQKLFIALVCVKDRCICCISYDQLKDLLQRRKDAKGVIEEQYAVLVTASKRKAFRVYVNAPGKKNKTLGTALVVARNRFPVAIFNGAVN